ncbi:MAG: AraC family transcriptional regulator [Bacteroides sp.]|nr:AraC family transcriptional regulator [Bacteroides sp.]
MDKIINLTHLTTLQNFSTEFSTHGDDYVFTRITESNRTLGQFKSGPVRFDGMSWFLCFGGQLDIEINLLPATLKPNTITVTPPDSFIEVKDIDWTDFDCYILFISRNFLRDINFDLNVMSAVPISAHNAEFTPVFDISHDEAKLLKEYYDILHHNTRNPDSTYSKSIARSVIAALTYQLIQLITLRQPADKTERPRTRRSAYVHDFMELVRKNHKTERSVAFYADKLFISPKYLSLIIKESIGRSAAEIIDEHVILEAKNLLRFSGKNIQQVSYELNFPNQSSFGKYFKHLVGMSPSEYQRSN